jgi:hypothetical protein
VELGEEDTFMAGFLDEGLEHQDLVCKIILLAENQRQVMFLFFLLDIQRIIDGSQLGQ